MMGPLHSIVYIYIMIILKSTFKSSLLEAKTESEKDGEPRNQVPEEGL